MAFSFVAGLYFQFKVRAVSEWNAEGEWAVESVIVELTQPPPMDGESSVVNLVQYLKKSLLSRGAHSFSASSQALFHVQEHFAPYCFASASPFEVCSSLDVTPYARQPSKCWSRHVKEMICTPLCTKL